MIPSEFQNFIVTSNTNEPKSELKEEILYQLILGIRSFFKDSFVVLSDSYYISQRIVDLTDFTLIDRSYKQFSYHGYPEMELLKNGLTLLNRYGKNYHYRLTYDFIMNEDNISAYMDWASKINDSTRLVFAKDNGHNPGVKTNVWFGENQLIENIIPNTMSHLETDFYKQVQKLNYSDKTFLYENSDEMFHGNINTYDLIGHGGTSFREEKIKYFKDYYKYSDEGNWI
jgi:hypothetical protein